MQRLVVLDGRRRRERVPLRELGFRDIQRQQGDFTNLRLLLETFSGSQHDDCTKLTLRALM
jgi:hypothetical protein